MKKILKVFAFLIFLGAGFVHAKDFSVWTAPEYTLQGASFSHDVLNNKDQLLTHYEMDKDLFSFIGAEAGFSWRFISIQGNLSWGIPKKCGQTIMDRHNPNDQKIIFEHRNYDSKFDAQNINLDTKLQFDIPVVKNWFNIRPYVGFAYTFAKYNLNFAGGRESIGDPKENFDYRLSGHQDEAAWNMNTRNIESGSDIWFKREQYDIKAGLILHGTLFERVFVDAEGAVSPFYFLNHKQNSGTDMYFLDIIEGNFCKWMIGAGAGVYLGKNNCFEVGTKFKYSIVNKIKGDSYQSRSESTGYDKNGTHAETEFQNWQLSIYGKYTFTFGPTHTPRPRHHRSSRTPKVRKGKVDVRVY